VDDTEVGDSFVDLAGTEGKERSRFRSRLANRNVHSGEENAAIRESYLPSCPICQ
jgi:hypothetical protein